VGIIIFGVFFETEIAIEIAIDLGVTLREKLRVRLYVSIFLIPKFRDKKGFPLPSFTQKNMELKQKNLHI